jgi:hypothetical protein
MDIVSHGLWGGVAFGRKRRRSFWLAFTFGIAPDLFSFGIFFIERLFTTGFDFSHRGRPELSSIPSYVDSLYNVTHSLIVFAVVFCAVSLILKRPVFEMCAWAFHIVMDIFTHGNEFFPTPFLWPLSDFHVDGISWGHPLIYFPNLALLLLAYAWFYYSKRKNRNHFS